MKKIVGLTGGVASGKSTVSRYLNDLGANIIDVDQIGHLLLKREDVKELVSKTFEGVLDNNEVSRKKLGALVFGNTAELEKLNNIMYPRMKEEILNHIIEGVNIVDMAILFESGFDEWCDLVVSVITSQANQIDRMTKRGYSETRIKGMLESQMRQKEKSARSDFVINNDESMQSLRKKVASLYNYILEN